MNVFTYDSFEAFVQANRNRIIRYWVYKRMYTPREQAEKYIDETQFEDTACNTGIIREVIRLCDGDYLLGIENGEFFDESPSDSMEYVEYYKLSEIRMAYSVRDQENEDDDE